MLYVLKNLMDFRWTINEASNQRSLGISVSDKGHETQRPHRFEARFWRPGPAWQDEWARAALYASPSRGTPYAAMERQGRRRRAPRRRTCHRRHRCRVAVAVAPLRGSPIPGQSRHASGCPCPDAEPKPERPRSVSPWRAGVGVPSTGPSQSIIMLLVYPSNLLIANRRWRCFLNLAYV